MRWSLVYVQLLFAVTFSLTQASHFSRDESNEQSKTEFNLASTFKGGISSNRHHERAHLNSQLYPDLTQLPNQQQGGDIDAHSGHESGGVGKIDLRAGPYGNSVGNPAQPQAPPAACGRPAPGTHPNAVPAGCQQPTGGQAPPPVGYPTQYPTQYPANPNPPAAAHAGGNAPGVYPSFGPQPGGYQPAQPGYAYPGVYLPQYPSYPPGYYPGYGPGAPGVPGNLPVAVPPGAPPISYQNQQNYAPHATPGRRDHWDHSFKMKTEYTEDGVHKGPFGVLNNHGGQGYGSGFGGGYNGAFNRPGY